MQKQEFLSGLGEDPLLTDRQIEELSDGLIKAATLRNWRSSGKYRTELPPIKIGSRVYTRKSNVEKVLAEGLA